MDLLKMNVLCVLFVLCISAITVQGRSKTPLMDEDGTRISNKAAECVFGSHRKELGSSWVPDLGVPIGVLYCMKCECVPAQRKRRIVARVQCRSIKKECPEPTCEEPVLQSGNCCKSCPGDNYSEEVQDVVPQHTGEDDDKNTKHYAALLTGRSSLVIGDDDNKPIPNDNRNNVIATGRFTFQKKNLYFSFYISDKAARPRSLQFVKHDGSILEETILETGGIVNSIYQNATRKVCGVWKRLPKAYRKLLKEEKLYVVLVWGVKDQAEFMLSGQITKYVALGTELFSSLLEPSPGTDPSKMAGAGGTAIVSTSSTVSPSIHIAIVFNGIFASNETNDTAIDITLSHEGKLTILQERVRVVKPAHELNLVEISSVVSPTDLRLLTRGRLFLTVSSVSNPTALRLSGNVMTKATCELFQTTLSSSGSNRNGTSGLAWLFLNNEGSLVYNILVDGLNPQNKEIYITLVDVSTKRKMELEDLTPSFSKGWANGTVDKIGPKVLEPLYRGNLSVNVATATESSLIRGRLSPRLVAEARDAAAPVLLKREDNSLPPSAVGMAWINVDNDCNIHYDVSLAGLGFHDRRLDLFLEFLPMIAPGAPVTTRYLGEIQGAQVEGSPTDSLRKDELKMLDSGVCFIKIKERRENRNQLILAATLKQVKVPSSCLPHYTDNDVPTLNSDPEIDIQQKCFYEGRFYQEEASWTSRQDPCTMCYCQNGNPKCDTTTCPELNCSADQRVKTAEECCAVCVNTTLSSQGCTFGGKFHSSGSRFHPFLIPNGFDFCTECVCDNSEVKCTRQSNEKQCCRNCGSMDVLKASENRTLLSDEFTLPKSPKQILDEGGCINRSNEKRPYENGEKFHPIIASLGEYKCVTCKCKNGRSNCERSRCTKALCHKIPKHQRNSTLNLNPPESCCSPQQCKKYSRHHKRQHKSSPQK